MIHRPFTDKIRFRFTCWWIALFYLLALYKCWQGMWLFQFNPFFFTTRFDALGFLFQSTGLPQQVIQEPLLRYVADITFYALPAVYLIITRFRPLLIPLCGALWLAVNVCYVLLYTSYPTLSIESQIAWLLFPLLFITRRITSFYYVLHGLRYFFLYFLVSAGIWKLLLGGAFYPAQMSAILLEQHKAWLLTSPPQHWQVYLLHWLIKMPLVSFALYWVALLIELSFIAGFFSRRYDGVLAIAFILFLMADYIVMRIPYFEVLPFLYLLLYSNYSRPVSGLEKSGEG